MSNSITIQLFAAYYQDLSNSDSPGVLCYGWAPLGKKPSWEYTEFDRVNTTSFDAWMICIEKMCCSIAESDYYRHNEDVTFEIVVHEKLTRNEYRSIAALLKVYKRLCLSEIDNITIATGKRLVVKGKKITQAMDVKRRLIEFMLVSKQKSKSISFKYNLIKSSFPSVTKDRLVSCYNHAESKSLVCTNNVIQLRA